MSKESSKNTCASVGVEAMLLGLMQGTCNLQTCRSDECEPSRLLGAMDLDEAMPKPLDLIPQEACVIFCA